MIFLFFLSSIFCQTAIITQTSQAGDRFRQYTASFGPFNNNTNNAFFIDPNQRKQTILGFGGAFTEAAAFNFFSMTPENQEKILEAYWGETGIGYTVGRFHINSCDFSIGSYSFDEVAWDFSLNQFDISHDKKMMIPFISKAIKKSASPLRLFGSPWSPPWWMKNNDTFYGYMLGSAIPRGLNKTCEDVWARYLSRVITEYEKALGIKIWGLTPQNEPEFAAPWEACVYRPQDEMDWIANSLGPIMQKDHPNLNILIYDHNKDDIVEWASAVAKNPKAAQYISGVAFHWYSGPQFDNLYSAHQILPKKIFLATEACCCPGVILNDWGRAESYAYDIIGDLNNYAVGWTDWNLVLNGMGGPNHLNGYCDAPVITFASNQTFFLQPTYYMMGHFSKFVLPNSFVLNLSNPFEFSHRFSTKNSSKNSSKNNKNVRNEYLVEDGSSVSAMAALRPDGKIVMVLQSQENDFLNYQIVIGNQALNITAPPHSIQTIVF